MDIEVEADVDMDSYFGCLKGASKSVQVPLNGMEAVMVLTLMILKWRALYMLPNSHGSLRTHVLRPGLVGPPMED